MNSTFTRVFLTCCLAASCHAGGGEGGVETGRDFSKEIINERSTAFSRTEPDLFQAGEWQLDTFGMYADTDRGERYSDGFGGGAGITHYWSRHWGAGLEGYWWEALPDEKWLHNVAASVLYRWPFDDLRLAPYALAGVGGHFNGEEEASGHVGGGLEWRFADRIGLFGDARYVLTTGPGDFGLYRTGLRFVF